MRSAMRAASQLPRRGPLMWMMPLHVNKKADYDDESLVFKKPLKRVFLQTVNFQDLHCL